MTSKKKWIFRLMLAAVLVLLICAGMAWFSPQTFLCVDSGPVQADVIIIPGGGAQDRPARAAELFKQGAAPRILVSGFGDAQIVRNALIAHGVPAAVIELESKSKTTEENALFSIKLLRGEKVKRAVIVTTWYHSRRALGTFEHFAPEIRFYSRPSYFAFKRSEWSRSWKKRIYLEYLKIPGYWIRYGVWPV